ITFFKDRDFEGCSCETTTDQPDLQAHLNCCNSAKVETGYWMIYERPNYIGHQYFLRKGEHPDYQHWMGFNDAIRSCCIITAVSFPYCLHVYYCLNDLGGRMLEFMDNCPSLQDDFHYRDIQSYNVLEGSWVFYEQPYFRGQQYLLRPGEYRRFTDWGAMTTKVGSFQPTVD
ncbi:CRGB protein, partial [Mesembrinibis cayennensis]|nr:CRGB protein [Mesembrinibis cayennensis]